MVVDVITYHKEAELFDLRYNILKDYVDEFIVMESMTLFNGMPKKELNFQKIQDKYPKVKYFVNAEQYTDEERNQAEQSPNTGGNHRWMHEFLQKEQLQKTMLHLKDDDTVFVGDVDEIWEPRLATEHNDGIIKLKLRVYTYYLNMHSSEQFWGNIKAKYKDIKGQCLNHLRNNSEEKNTKDYCGWHFTSQGGIDAVKQKLIDQYNAEVFNPVVYNNLDKVFGKADFIGRDFTLTVDESEWPQYLKDNKIKYQNLCK